MDRHLSSLHKSSDESGNYLSPERTPLLPGQICWIPCGLVFGKRQPLSDAIAVMEKHSRTGNQKIGKLVYRHQHCASVAELIICLSSRLTLMGVRNKEKKGPRT